MGVDAGRKLTRQFHVSCLNFKQEIVEVITMVMYAKIRWMYYREHQSMNEIQRRTSLSRNTIKKWLRASGDSAVKYQRAKKSGKLTPFKPGLLLALEADARRPKKDRRTAKMLFKAILNEGYTGGYTIVCDFIRNKAAKALRLCRSSLHWVKHSSLTGVKSG